MDNEVIINNIKSIYIIKNICLIKYKINKFKITFY